MPPTLISSTQSPGVPPFDSTSLMRTSAGAAGGRRADRRVTVPVSVQSPSLTVSVSVETPAAVQLASDSPSSRPRASPSSRPTSRSAPTGFPSESCAAELIALENPTITSPGLAPTASTTGQTLTVPLIWTLPVLAGSRH